MFLTDQSLAGKNRPSSYNGDPRSEARKPRDQRTALGQVFTPEALADRMVRNLDIPTLGSTPAILDPCVGPDTFPSAIRRAGHGIWIMDAIDVDGRMCAMTSAAGDDRVNVQHVDFLTRPANTYDAAILNPPYVRQEWIEDKGRVGELIKETTGAAIPGTANLYVYFIVKVISELRVGGRMACLVYDSWQSTLYGRWLRDYLDQRCEWTSEAVPNCPFEGRLIDATIIYATKRDQPGLRKPNDDVENILASGCACIDELFHTKRGLRLKQSSFFLTSASRQGQENSTRFVKKVNRIAGHCVAPDHDEAALLISSISDNPRTMRVLERRLAEARLVPEKNVAILTWADERPDNWCLHGPAPKAPILFNYFMRHRPKHIANPANIAFSDNFYGLIPKNEVSDTAWFAALNSSVSAAGILRQARNQGAGLAKVQLFEYRAARVVDIRDWPSSDIQRLETLGLALRLEQHSFNQATAEIDLLIANVTGDPSLDPEHVAQELVLADRNAKRPGEFN